MKRLPKKHEGAEVVRGLATSSTSNFEAGHEMWIVVQDAALADDDSVEVKAFATKALAVRYARACANGNVDHRVLRVTAQVLVVATMNEL